MTLKTLSIAIVAVAFTFGATAYAQTKPAKPAAAATDGAMKKHVRKHHHHAHKPKAAADGK